MSRGAPDDDDTDDDDDDDDPDDETGMTTTVAPRCTVPDRYATEFAFAVG